MKTMITLKNDFHHTETKIRVKPGRNVISRSVQKRVKRALCTATCQCSGIMGIRGPQQDDPPWELDYAMGQDGFEQAVIVI